MHINHQLRGLRTTSMILLSTEKRCTESCVLSFIWGKMKTAAQETAPQIALRNCSEELVGEGQYVSVNYKLALTKNIAND